MIVFIKREKKLKILCLRILRIALVLFKTSKNSSVYNVTDGKKSKKDIKI